MKKLLFRVFLIAAVLAAAWYSYGFIKQLPDRQREVATARVRRGDVVVRTFSRGELRAVRSQTLAAPNLFGTVQVIRLAPLGSFARKGDLVVEFDDAEVQSRMEEKELELEQTEERIIKSEADLAIRNNQDEVELLRARYSVRRAELEVKRNELISAIDARKNVLNLEEARKRLDKLKSDILSRHAQAEAELAVLAETKNKAVLELQREKQRLSRVKLLSPMSGLVAIRQARSHFFFAGTTMPDIREGDELRPGMSVVDVLDLSELEVVARVGELDRANLHVGQEVIIRLDALADQEVHGKIKTLSGTASADVYSNDPAKKFDVTFEVDMRELLETLGAEPEQIERILATAEQNRKRSPSAGSSLSSRMLSGAAGGMMGGMMGGGGGDMMAAMRNMQQGGSSGGAGGDMMAAMRNMQQGGGGAGGGMGQGGEGGQASGGRRGQGGSTNMLARMTSGLSEEDRKKVQETLEKELKGKKLEDLEQSERRNIFQKLRALTGGGQQGGRSGRGSGGSDDAETGGQRSARGAGQGGSEGGGQRAGRGGGQSSFEGGLPASFGRSSGPQFTEEQVANAKLPPPPEEDSQLDVLLRPGLLADVEIIVENIPDAIYVPVYAVFDNGTKVFVKTDGRFEERAVEVLKRSESVMVISKGLEEGELVALADPNAKPGEQSEARSSGSAAGTSPMGGFGGGGMGRGGGGPRGGR